MTTESKSQTFNNAWVFTTQPHGKELLGGLAHRTPAKAPLVGPNGEWMGTGGSTNIDTFIAKNDFPYITFPEWDHWMLDEEATRLHRLSKGALERMFDEEGIEYELALLDEEADMTTQQTPDGVQFHFLKGNYNPDTGEIDRGKFPAGSQRHSNSHHYKFWKRVERPEAVKDPGAVIVSMVQQIIQDAMRERTEDA